MNNEELTQKVVELEARIQKLEKASPSMRGDMSSAESRRAKVSIVEFLKEKKPISLKDKTLVISLFFERDSGSETFSAEDLLKLWRQAKETLPSNINDLINQNIKKGLIAEETTKKDGKKCWYVTRSGVEVVDKGFQE